VAGDVERGAVVRRGAREREAERDVYRAAERRDLDRRHPDVVIRRDDGIELAADGAHEHGVGGERSFDLRFARGRREHLFIFISEAATVARVRVERAEGDPRLGDAEPFAESFTRQRGDRKNALAREGVRNLAERDVSRREDHAQPVGREHHRHA